MSAHLVRTDMVPAWICDRLNLGEVFVCFYIGRRTVFLPSFRPTEISVRKRQRQRMVYIAYNVIIRYRWNQAVSGLEVNDLGSKINTWTFVKLYVYLNIRTRHDWIKLSNHVCYNNKQHQPRPKRAQAKCTWTGPEVTFFIHAEDIKF